MTHGARPGLAVVTGAARGIGAAVALSLARRGHPVCALDLAFDDGEDTMAQSLRAAGAPEAVASRFDLADVVGHTAAVDSIERRFGPVAILINNAGIGSPQRGDLLDLSPANFDRVVEVNLRGTFFFTQAMARRMLAHPAPGPRSIVTISSVSAAMASPDRGEYCLAKSALPMLTQLFALRLAAAGIAVFELRPGIIRTPMTEGVAARYDGLIEGGLVPAGRWGEPEDVGQAVAGLVSGAFRFATGSVISLDGGLSVPRL